MANGFYVGISFAPNNDGQIILPDAPADNHPRPIDPQKQLIHKYIQSYQPVIDLLKDTMHHFDQAILDDHVSVERKRILCDIFTTA